jgi:hypothetical protein
MPRYVHMATDGSYTGRLALATLAADLGVTSDVLKIVLTEAFDLMQNHSDGSAGLSLHLALAREGYQINGQVLYARLNAFRNVFEEALHVSPGRNQFTYSADF